MAATGRVNVFARVRPGVAREDGDQHCVDMNTDTGKCLSRQAPGWGRGGAGPRPGGSAAIRTVKSTRSTACSTESNQKEVYEDVEPAVLKDVLRGTTEASWRTARRARARHSLLNSGMGVDGKPRPEAGWFAPQARRGALRARRGADVESTCY